MTLTSRDRHVLLANLSTDEVAESESELTTDELSAISGGCKPQNPWPEDPIYQPEPVEDPWKTCPE